jgi:hypothetical protein
MVAVLSQMRSDIQNDETGLVMEFVVLQNSRISFNHPKRRFVYYEEEHPNLQLVIDRLLDMEFVKVVKKITGDRPIYRMTPAFVAALRGTTSVARVSETSGG